MPGVNASGVCNAQTVRKAPIQYRVGKAGGGAAKDSVATFSELMQLFDVMACTPPKIGVAYLSFSCGVDRVISVQMLSFAIQLTSAFVAFSVKIFRV